MNATSVNHHDSPRLTKAQRRAQKRTEAEARNNARMTSANGVNASEPVPEKMAKDEPNEVQGGEATDLEEIDEAFLAILKEDSLGSSSETAREPEGEPESSMSTNQTEDETVARTDEAQAKVDPERDFEVQLEPDVSEPQTPEPAPPSPPASRSASRQKTPRGKAMMDHAPDTRVKMPRADTDRGMVLGMMDGTKTPEEIATVLKKRNARFDVKYVYAHAYCLRRDCGIGYRTVDGKLEAVFPPAGGTSP